MCDFYVFPSGFLCVCSPNMLITQEREMWLVLCFSLLLAGRFTANRASIKTLSVHSKLVWTLLCIQMSCLTWKNRFGGSGGRRRKRKHKFNYKEGRELWKVFLSTTSMRIFSQSFLECLSVAKRENPKMLEKRELLQLKSIHSLVNNSVVGEKFQKDSWVKRD